MLEAVADWNAAVTHGETDGDNDWALAVEVGEPLDILQLDSPKVYYDGLELEAQRIVRPTRLVRPTAAELEHFARREVA